MASVFIEYPKGLGDHIRFSAIVREYCTQYEKVGIFSTRQYLPSVRFLFRDIPAVEIHPADTVPERQAVFKDSSKNSPTYEKVLQLEPDEELGIAAERLIYAMAGVPFQRRWNGFHVARDRERESQCQAAIAPDKPYLFIHDDDRYPIDLSRIASALPTVHPANTDNPIVFDYCETLEGAAEIHVIDSVFMFLVDQLAYTNPEQKLFVHRYARPLRPFYLPILKKPWTILE